MIELIARAAVLGIVALVALINGGDTQQNGTQLGAPQQQHDK